MEKIDSKGTEQERRQAAPTKINERQRGPGEKTRAAEGWTSMSASDIGSRLQSAVAVRRHFITLKPELRAPEKMKGGRRQERGGRAGVGIEVSVETCIPAPSFRSPPEPSPTVVTSLNWDNDTCLTRYPRVASGKHLVQAMARRGQGFLKEQLFLLLNKI